MFPISSDFHDLVQVWEKGRIRYITFLIKQIGEGIPFDQGFIVFVLPMYTESLDRVSLLGLLPTRL